MPDSPALKPTPLTVTGDPTVPLVEPIVMPGVTVKDAVTGVVVTEPEAAIVCDTPEAEAGIMMLVLQKPDELAWIPVASWTLS